jgi:acetylornithine deacetylase/succinyl-diaminopimelate desuccinylase-like protein
MRLVPDQHPDRILALFQERVRSLRPPGIELEVQVHSTSQPVLTLSDSPYVQAARRALHAPFGRPAVLVRVGGSIPIVSVFKEALGADSVLMGWGLPDDNLHAPNEKLSLDNFYGGIDAAIRYWEELGHTV